MASHAGKYYVKVAIKRSKKHGHTYFDGRKQSSHEYYSWMNMRGRCFNPKHAGFERWGGRGITVCDRWKNSFENFLADMGPKPTPSHTIDRINSNGNYEPSNCRWASPKEQAAYRKGSKTSEETKKRMSAGLREWWKLRRIGLHGKRKMKPRNAPDAN